jgi:hypothetical protein
MIYECNLLLQEHISFFLCVVFSRWINMVYHVSSIFDIVHLIYLTSHLLPEISYIVTSIDHSFFSGNHNLSRFMYKNFFGPVKY